MSQKSQSQKLEPSFAQATTVPVVRIRLLTEDFAAPELLPQILAEINDRQWAAITQVLLEAKFKAESMLRNDAVFDSSGRCTYYQGWVAYADYIIGSLDALRSGSEGPQSESSTAQERQPGPPE